MPLKKISSRFLKWFCDPFLFDELSGDLEESYHLNMDRFGKTRAEFIYTGEVLAMLRPSIMKIFKANSTTRTFMIKHTTKIALRTMKKEKWYSLINIFGLSSSMAICLLIILFYVDQRSMDKHNDQYHNIHRILTKEISENGRDVYQATSPHDIPERLAANFEDIEVTSQFARHAEQIKNGDRVFGFNGLLVEENFIDFFDFQLSGGNPNTALKESNSVVLSDELAYKLFPDTEAIGQSVEIPSMGTFEVTGVFVPFQKRSHISLDLAISMKSKPKNPMADNDLAGWIESGQKYYNYYRTSTNKRIDVDSYLSSLSMLFHDEGFEDKSLVSQPMKKINFGVVVRNEPGFATAFVVPWFLGILGAVVMLSACFNYIGLSIAQSLKRAKEVGIRRVIGAHKKHLILQFIVEAQITVFVSWLLAMMLLYLIVPFFNDLKVLRDIDGAIRLNVLTNFSLYGLFLGFSVLIGLISGGYPAWYIGKLAYQDMVKVNKKKPGFWVRKSLVFLQYATSIIFIVTAIALNRQADHFFKMNYQFRTEQLMSVELLDLDNYESLKSALLDQSHVPTVSLSSALPALTIMPEMLVSLTENSEETAVRTFSINGEFLENFDLTLKAGENFRDAATDKGYVLVNERFCEEFGLDPRQVVATQTVVHVADREENYKILGVVEDFKYQLLFRESGPLVLTYEPDQLKYLNIQYLGWNETEAAEQVETVWREFDRDNLFTYHHYDFTLEDMYGEFMDLADLVTWVAALGILIACIGQFGMILHHVSLKTKEIGIRKVMGSTASGLILLLSKGHLLLLLVAVAFGTPIAYWMNNQWTQKLGNAIDMNLWIIVQGLVVVFALSGAAIFILTTRAANANPARTLKYE